MTIKRAGFYKKRQVNEGIRMMTKQRSLFQKYLRVNLAIVLVSFLLIGVVLLIFMTSYWRSEKTALLKKNAEGISVVASQNLIPLGDNSYRIDSRVGTMIDLFAQNIDAQIFLTDGNGTPVLYSQSATTFAAAPPWEEFFKILIM